MEMCFDSGLKLWLILSVTCVSACIYEPLQRKTKYGSFINVVTKDIDFLPISLICDFSKQNP